MVATGSGVRIAINLPAALIQPCRRIWNMVAPLLPLLRDVPDINRGEKNLHVWEEAFCFEFPVCLPALELAYLARIGFVENIIVSRLNILRRLGVLLTILYVLTILNIIVCGWWLVAERLVGWLTAWLPALIGIW